MHSRLDATYHFPCEKERWKKDESRGWAKCFWLDMRTHARTSEHAAPLYVAKGRHQRAAQSMQQAVGNTVATATHGSYTLSFDDTNTHAYPAIPCTPISKFKRKGEEETWVYQ
jgi:hypothetical protein